MSFKYKQMDLFMLPTKCYVINDINFEKKEDRIANQMILFLLKKLL